MKKKQLLDENERLDILTKTLILEKNNMCDKNTALVQENIVLKARLDMARNQLNNVNAAFVDYVIESRMKA